MVFAVFWVGGGVAMIVLGAAAALARDDARLIGVVRQVVFLAGRLFVPSSLLTVIFGVVMAWFAHSFATLWIALGLAGFAATFVTGVFFIKPMADRAAAIFASEGNTRAVAALSRRILRASIFDYTMILLVVAVMVLKPAAEDGVTLAVMAAILILAGLAVFAAGWGRPPQ